MSHHDLTAQQAWDLLLSILDFLSLTHPQTLSLFGVLCTLKDLHCELRIQRPTAATIMTKEHIDIIDCILAELRGIDLARCSLVATHFSRAKAFLYSTVYYGADGTRPGPLPTISDVPVECQKYVKNLIVGASDLDCKVQLQDLSQLASFHNLLSVAISGCNCLQISQVLQCLEFAPGLRSLRWDLIWNSEGPWAVLRPSITIPQSLFSHNFRSFQISAPIIRDLDSSSDTNIYSDLFAEFASHLESADTVNLHHLSWNYPWRRTPPFLTCLSLVNINGDSNIISEFLNGSAHLQKLTYHEVHQNDILLNLSDLVLPDAALGQLEVFLGGSRDIAWALRRRNLSRLRKVGVVGPAVHWDCATLSRVHDGLSLHKSWLSALSITSNLFDLLAARDPGIIMGLQYLQLKEELPKADGYVDWETWEARLVAFPLASNLKYLALCGLYTPETNQVEYDGVCWTQDTLLSVVPLASRFPALECIYTFAYGGYEFHQVHLVLRSSTDPCLVHSPGISRRREEDGVNGAWIGRRAWRESVTDSIIGLTAGFHHCDCSHNTGYCERQFFEVQ